MSTKMFFTPFIKEIVVQYPINVLDKEDFGHITVIGNKKIWQTFMIGEKTMFRLISPVRLGVDLQTGFERTRRQGVTLAIKDIVWIEGGEPKDLNTTLTYGDSNVCHKRERVNTMVRDSQKF